MSFAKKAYEKVFGSQNEKTLKNYHETVVKINALEGVYEKLSNEQVQAKTQEFRDRLKKGETLDNILPEAFATVREAAKRVMGMRHYDVQMIGGMTIHSGQIAEMRTGEGKTLVATLPTYLNALESKGVHVITVNDYLALRDAVWMGQVYDFLGMSVGIIQGQRVSYIYDVDAKNKKLTEEGSDTDKERDELSSVTVEHDYLIPASRRETYRCDITYGTNNEFGFDYLRDNMVQNISDMVMRPGDEMHFAVIDEIDSILIDEARTPLIISAPAEEAGEKYYQFARLVKQLKENEDYNIDEKLRSSTLTEEGIKKFENWLGIENIYVAGGIRIVHHVEQALKAEVLFKRDKDYVVEENNVVIIDEFTGRKMPGRRFSQGLHQALEAKENVVIQRESRTLATITFQNLFRMYNKLAGMTGTAVTEEEEFLSIYGLDVVVIPTNKPDARIDRPDRIYRTSEAKYKAIVKQIEECRAKGQPILIGTISVEKNEELAQFLSLHNVEHEILNAKNHEREGEIIAQAGRPGAVTLATNIAGRGVDIKLGGFPLDKEIEKQVISSGGLFVLGSERHDSRRIDNQLRGRSARQGDPGETQFYVCTDDDLMRIFAGERLKAIMTRLNVPDDMPIEQRAITRMLENAQKKVEGHNFDIRKHLLEYDDVLNKQRHVVYKKRREILDISDGENKEKTTGDLINEMIEQEIEFIVSYHTNTDQIENEKDKDWNMKEIYETMKTIVSFNNEEREQLLHMVSNGEDKMDEVKARESIIQFLIKKTKEEHQNIKNTIQKTVGEEKVDKAVKGLEKGILLRSIDSLWVEYLVEIRRLRKGIGLRGYGQRDPLIEYKKETYHMFNSLLASIQKEVVYSFFKVGIGLQLAPSVMASDKMTLQGAKKTSSEQGRHIQKKIRDDSGKKVGRNDQCPCGSGKKYKKCHGK